jgi:hypothetical protein
VLFDLGQINYDATYTLGASFSLLSVRFFMMQFGVVMTAQKYLIFVKKRGILINEAGTPA